MSPVTHQTIKLGKGKHASPDDGACVMELASMLAGEPFSDHPATVCPVIGSFLRAYNDAIDDDRRQDLYAYASRIVGSRESVSVQRDRADRLAEWAVEMQRRQWIRRYLPMTRLRMASLRRQPSPHAVGTYAVRAIPKHTGETHASTLALIDELLTMRSSSPPALTTKESTPSSLGTLFPVG